MNCSIYRCKDSANRHHLKRDVNFMRSRFTKDFSVKLLMFSYPSNFAFALGALRNRLIETVILSTHNICFG